MMKLIARSPLKREKYSTEYRAISQDYRMDKKSPPVSSLGTIFALCSLVLHRISPNFPPSHHMQASSTLVAEESPWQQKCGLF